jgi:hypothetical protein
MFDPLDWQHVTDPKRHAHSYLFALALREDSNLAMDWLWRANLLHDEQERQYCLHRARYIDPDCVVVVHTRRSLFEKLRNVVQTWAARTTTPVRPMGE